MPSLPDLFFEALLTSASKPIANGKWFWMSRTTKQQAGLATEPGRRHELFAGLSLIGVILWCTAQDVRHVHVQVPCLTTKPLAHMALMQLCCAPVDASTSLHRGPKSNTCWSALQRLGCTSFNPSGLDITICQAICIQKKSKYDRTL